MRQSRQTTTFQHSQHLSHTQSATVPDAAEWQRVTPIDRLHTGDVLTSIADGSVAFIVATIAVAGIIWQIGGFVRVEGHTYQIAYILAPGVGLAAFCYRYFGGMQIARSLLEIIETATNKDIDGDGHIGPPPEPQVVKVEVKTNKRWQFAYLQITPVKLRGLAVATLGGEGFTERSATKAGLTQEEFKRLREEFLGRGWAQWNHPKRKQQGVKVLGTGRMILRSILDTPLPQSQDRANHATDSTQQHAARNSDGNYEFVE